MIVKIQKALDLYDNFDNPLNPSPVVKVKNDLYVNEQYHGSVRAFKDMALYLLEVFLALLHKKEVKITYTSSNFWDTGPAALNTFRK